MAGCSSITELSGEYIQEVLNAISDVHKCYQLVHWELLDAGMVRGKQAGHIRGAVQILGKKDKVDVKYLDFYIKVDERGRFLVK